MSIFVIGLNHQTAPVDVREKLAFQEHTIPEALERLRLSGVVEEAVILSTCNRVEIYGATESACPKTTLLDLSRFLQLHHQFQGELHNVIYTHAAPKSIEHLFKVACGLDSMVLGETEILGQLKKAYQIALDAKHTGGRLNKAFQKAFHVAKHIRTETNIQRGSISVSSVGVELTEKIFNSLEDRQVLVIGAGDTSEKAARALKSRGASRILVTNRSQEKAEHLAQQLGGETLDFQKWEDHCLEVDIIISSTSAPGYILDRHQAEKIMRQRKYRPLLLIDLAVPRDIDPEVNSLENAYLYNVDDLKAIADDYLKLRQDEMIHCNHLIQEKVGSLWTPHASSNPSPQRISHPSKGIA